MKTCKICGKEAECFDLGTPYCLEHELETKKATYEGLGLDWKPEIPPFMLKLHPELRRFMKDD